MQVGRAIPDLWEGFGNRSTSAKQNLQPHPVVGKIAVGDDDLAADAEGFADDFDRGNEFLKGAEQQDVVEGLFAVLVEAFGDVALVDDESALDAAATMPDRLAGSNRVTISSAKTLGENLTFPRELKHA